jgi:hypothetical protein
MVEVIFKVTVRACVWLFTRQIFERVVELFSGARFGCYRRQIMRREGREAAFSGTRDEAATNEGVCSSIYVSFKASFLAGDSIIKELTCPLPFLLVFTSHSLVRLLQALVLVRNSKGVRLPVVLSPP